MEQDFRQQATVQAARMLKDLRAELVEFVQSEEALCDEEESRLGIETSGAVALLEAASDTSLSYLALERAVYADEAPLVHRGLHAAVEAAPRELTLTLTPTQTQTLTLTPTRTPTLTLTVSRPSSRTGSRSPSAQACASSRATATPRCSWASRWRRGCTRPPTTSACCTARRWAACARPLCRGAVCSAR